MRLEEVVNGTSTRAGRLVRLNVIGRINRPAWRRMIGETYPAQLPPPPESGWWERYGKDVIVVQPDPEVVAHAHHLLERARRAGTVAVGPADRDEVYAAQVDEKARRRAHLGRGVCSGWADEDDYGPRCS